MRVSGAHLHGSANDIVHSGIIYRYLVTIRGTGAPRQESACGIVHSRIIFY